MSLSAWLEINRLYLVQMSKTPQNGYPGVGQ